MIVAFGLTIVGVILLLAGVVKVLDSKKFTELLLRYGLPLRFASQLATILIGLECAWGTALIVQVFPRYLSIGTIALLLVLSGLTLWATSVGRTEDCGCYGDVLIITPKQSVLLNLGYCLLLTPLLLADDLLANSAVGWQWVVILSALMIGSVLSWQSRNKPLIDLSRLQVGKRWQSRWLSNQSQRLLEGSHFVVFLGKDCPFCKEWIPLLNVMKIRTDLPGVTGVMAATAEEIEAFASQYSVQFPLVSMNKILFQHMVSGVPTGVLLEDGVIVNKLVGEMPKELSDRIKQFYRSIQFEPVGVSSRFAG